MTCSDAELLELGARNPKGILRRVRCDIKGMLNRSWFSQLCSSFQLWRHYQVSGQIPFETTKRGQHTAFRRKL